MGVYDGGWRVDSALFAEEKAPPRPETAVVVVALGTNDASGNLTNTHLTPPLAGFDAQYAQLVARLRQAAPKAVFVCLTAWWGQTASAYNAAIVAECPSGGHIIDLASLYAIPAYHGPSGLPDGWFRPGYTTDWTHPNDAGMAAIALAIEASLLI